MTVRQWLLRIFVCPVRGHRDTPGTRWGWHLDYSTFMYCMRCDREAR